jgi:hypothetical protein
VTLSNATIPQNGTVDVIITLVGSGYELLPDPIDVVLCTDRSGSMLINGTDGIPDDRMIHAMNAAKTFNSNMTVRDRIGLVSFGDNSGTNGWANLNSSLPNAYSNRYWAGRDSTYSDDKSYVSRYYKGNPRYCGTDASQDLVLSFDRNLVNSAVEQMVPAGGTPMREGLYQSIKMIRDNPNLQYPDAVKAIILLTDGAWNTGGDPQGGSSAKSFPEIGTGSVITWANESKTRIYTIALGSDPNQAELEQYAIETGGRSYTTPTADQLSSIYSLIAGELRTEAGVNTTADLNFQNLEISGVTVPGAEVLEYVPLAGVSTSIILPNGTSQYKNQAEEWNATHTLSFNVGTVKLNEQWQASFRLIAKREGTFNIFGSDSVVTFESADGMDIMHLPNKTISVKPNLSNSGINFMGLMLSDLTAIRSAPDWISVSWTLNYTGTKTASEEASYSIDGGRTWKRITSLVRSSGLHNEHTGLDLRQIPGTSEYHIRIEASGEDGGWDRKETQIIVGEQTAAFIKLE